jgi:hypothetical protein
MWAGSITTNCYVLDVDAGGNELRPRSPNRFQQVHATVVDGGDMDPIYHASQRIIPSARLDPVGFEPLASVR